MPSTVLAKASDFAVTAITLGMGEGFAESHAIQANAFNRWQKEGQQLARASKAPIAVFSRKTRSTKELMSDFQISQNALSEAASASGLELSRNEDSGHLQLQPAGANAPKMDVSLRDVSLKHSPNYPDAIKSGDSLFDLMAHQAIQNFSYQEEQYPTAKRFSGTHLTIDNVPNEGAAKDGVVALMHNLAGNDEKAHAIVGARIPRGLTGSVFADEKVVSDPNKNGPIDWPSAPLAALPAYTE